MPYANRNTWKKLQMECPDLRRTHGFLSQGPCPSSKNTKCTTTKRYLQKVNISKDGLLVYKNNCSSSTLTARFVDFISYSF